MLDPILVSAQNYSRDVTIGLRYLTGRFCPIQKPPNRFRLPARLALRQNGLASLSETDVRQMKRELAALRPVEQVGGGWSVMMGRGSVGEQPVRLDENVRHCFQE